MREGTNCNKFLVSIDFNPPIVDLLAFIFSQCIHWESRHLTHKTKGVSVVFTLAKVSRRLTSTISLITVLNPGNKRFLRLLTHLYCVSDSPFPHHPSSLYETFIISVSVRLLGSGVLTIDEVTLH